MKKHTKGPWFILPGVEGGVYCVWSRSVDLYSQNKPPIARTASKDDAKLIAIAPEMYEALQFILADLNDPFGVVNKKEYIRFISNILNKIQGE